MTFKRASLCPKRRLVNAFFAVGVAGVAACSGERDESADAPANIEPAAIELPVVWGTRTLDATPIALAYSGGAGPVLAAAYETGRYQLFDLNGDRLTNVGDGDIVALGTGVTTEIDGLSVTAFPALDVDGALKAILYNPQLDAPALVEVSGVEAEIAGLCAIEKNDGVAILDIAYWTTSEPTILRKGGLAIVAEAFVVTPADETTFETPIESCALGRNRSHASLDPNAALVATFERSALSGHFAFRMDTQTYAFERTGGAPEPLSLKNGLSVSAPDRPTALAALGDVRFGGYPGGVLAIGGRVNGDAKIVFVDPSALTRPAP